MPEIELTAVHPNPAQPRKTFDPAKLQELAASIRENGLLQPITVTPRDDAYLIVAGERRYRAAQLAGLQTIACSIRELDDPTVARLALLENVQREDMDPIDTALAYQTLVNAGATPTEVAKMIGKTNTEVCTYLALNKLDPAITDAVKRGILSTRNGWDLARLDETNDQRTIFAKLAHGEITPSQLGAFVSSWIEAKNASTFFGPPETRERAETRAHRVRTVSERVAAAAKSYASLDSAVDFACEDAAELSTSDLYTIDELAKSFARLHVRLTNAARRREIVAELRLASV